MAVLRKPGEALTLEDIAAWCDCRPSTIQRIEKSAMKKAWWGAQNPKARRAILAAMKPTKTAKSPFKYQQQFGLIVVCKDEADQQKKFDQLKKRGLAVRVVTV